MPPLILTRLSRPAIIFSSNRSFPFSLTELLNTYFLHWSPEKALWIGAHTLSWDARCAGIHIGFGIGVLCHLLLDRRASRLPRLSILALAGLLFIPLFLDVFTVELGLRAPSNDWRFLTGLMFGEALSVFLFPAFVMLTVAKRRERAALSGDAPCLDWSARFCSATSFAFSLPIFSARTEAAFFCDPDSDQR